MARFSKTLRDKYKFISVLFVLYLLHSFPVRVNLRRLTDEAQPPIPVDVPVIDLHVDLLALKTKLWKSLPSVQEMGIRLAAFYDSTTVPERIGLDLVIFPYWPSEPRPGYGGGGWTIELRAFDRVSGEILSAAGNENHRPGPPYLWRWAMGRLGRVVEVAKRNLQDQGRARLPRVAVDTSGWTCTWGERFAKATRERFLDELLWTNRVVPVKARWEKNAGYLVSGNLAESDRPERFPYLDILQIKLADSRSDSVLLRKTFIAEPGLPGCSPQIEAPLANAQTAARVVAQFLGDLSTGPVEKPRIVPRAEWGARKPKQRIESLRYPGDPREYLNWIVVHHTAYTPSGPREVQDEHMLRKGIGPGKHPYGRNWVDVGYHFMIAKDGTIYEGRKIRYVGAHAGGTEYGETDPRLRSDFGAIGVALFGDFTVERPTANQLKSLYSLLNYLTRYYVILPDHVVTHREMWFLSRWVRPLGGPTTPETVCPGENLRKLVEEWRDRRFR